MIDCDDPANAALRTAAIAAGTALVQVVRWTHRGARPFDGAAVWLESSAVRRATLVDSVALAAGREIPATQADPEPLRMPSAPDRAEAAAHGRLILVAEDNEMNRKVIQQQLALLGHSTDVVVDGEEAFERWRSGDYGLLLTDLHMPGSDGYVLTARIRAEEASLASSGSAGKRIPILALTANALRGEAERCMTLGMDDYLTKPLLLDALRKTLTRWLPQSPGSSDQD